MINFLKFKNLNPVKYQIRKLFGYVRHAFNTVDSDRLKLVGPDRLCAEWVLKNSGGVVFAEIPNKLMKNYNALPPESLKLTLNVIDASNASIMGEGFEHLKGCVSIHRIILHNCKHLESDALKRLKYVQTTLTYLQVSGCYNINDAGMMHCQDLTNLRNFKIFDMPYVKKMDEVVEELKKTIPECQFELG